MAGAVIAAAFAAGACGRLEAAGTLPLHECRLEHPLELTSLPARCGVLRVPEDPASPGGASIDLRLAVVPALDRRASAAPLFVLAGGPGQAATDLYVGLAGAFARIHREHDIVLLDQRGTGGSAPLRCSYPDDWRQSGEDLTAIRQATVECLSKYGERVRFYTSSVALLDLERARLALGYGAIDLYGSSYGTRMAELYMRRFAQWTHAVILDGVTYPQQAIGPETPADGERALGLIVTRCLEAADCAAAYPDLSGELAALRAQYGPQRAALSLADPASGEPLELEFSRSTLAAGLRFLSYSAAQAALLPTLIHEAHAGRLAPLAAQVVMTAQAVRDQLATGMQMSVVCSEDVPYFALDAAARQRMAATYLGTEQLDALEEICKLWPKGPVDADLHSALVSDVPSLLLSGEADPVTPPADAERLARGLGRHRHLVLDGEGHGQAATGCVPVLMARFLEAPDPARLDASCLERHRPAPFFVRLSGPAP